VKVGTVVRLALPSKSRWIRAVRRTGSRVPAVDARWRRLPTGDLTAAGGEPA